MNTGSRPGAGVAQVYITYPDSGVTHPPLQLKAFSKANNLAPGESRRVDMDLDKYAVSYWHESGGRWQAQQGVYRVRAGGSSENLPLEGTFELQKGFTWTGL
jgi:beta-glucosidase